MSDESIKPPCAPNNSIKSASNTKSQVKLDGSCLKQDKVNSYIFINGVEIYKFKAKNFEINAAPLCLGNVSKDFSVGNMRKTGLHGYIYDFSVDYDSIYFDDILDIWIFISI